MHRYMNHCKSINNLPRARLVTVSPHVCQLLTVRDNGLMLSGGPQAFAQLQHAFITSSLSPRICTCGVYAFVSKRPGFGLHIDGFHNMCLQDAVHQHLRRANRLTCGIQLDSRYSRWLPVYMEMLQFGLRDVYVIPLQLLQPGTTHADVLHFVSQWYSVLANVRC